MIMYASATLLTMWIIQKPELFILESVPRQFFPHFLNPGPDYWLFAVFFLVSSLYIFISLGLYYPKMEKMDRNRLNYFFASFGVVYVIGSLFFLPIFGINISMLPTALIGLYTVPLAYGLLKYDLLDVHVVARHALGYFIAVSTVGFLTAGVNVVNNYLVRHFTGFPFWPIPFFTGIMILGIGALIWRHIRQADILKYEFINNISHKFRTPLTHIRWLAEELRDADTAEERNRAVDQIQFASLRLFELTSAVIDVSKDENDLYLYRFTSVKIHEVLRDLFTTHSDVIERKKLHVHIDVPDNMPNIQADKTRISFAMQIIFENALIYTKEAGEVIVKARQIGGEVLITCRDDGIGIPVDDVSRIFSKFYRSTNARHTDTEGMGIGLYMAKNIIEKHKGSVSASSQGENLGSEFTVALPIE
jgi:signal transduction histidine kinase